MRTYDGNIGQELRQISADIVLQDYVCEYLSRTA
jgi:hypothetical protein